MEKAQGMRLHDLRQAEDAAQLVGSRRGAHGEKAVQSPGRSAEGADWADAANARHQRRHLGKRAPFAEFLEPAELCDVETCVFDTTFVVQMKSDLGVPFDPGDWIDHNRLFG